MASFKVAGIIPGQPTEEDVPHLGENPVSSQDPNEPFDPDEPPPKPPDTLDVFEHQRYLSKLIEWGLEASKRERSRPHLVERDDDDEDDPD